MSDLVSAPRSAGPLRRAVLWLLVLAVAAGTGLFWSGQRRVRQVDATVRLAAEGDLATDGTLRVAEELVVVTADRDALRRVIPAAGGVRWVGVTADDGTRVDHTTVDLDAGLQVTVPLDGDPQVLHLRYDLLDAATAGTDAAEVAWEPLDDRNPLAVEAAELDLRWAGGEAAAVEVEAPGAAPTVVGRDGGLRVEAGAVRAHHVLEVHAALPLAAAGDAVPEDRSVMAGMGEDAGGAAAQAADGGPWWLPVAVAVAFGAVWLLAQRRHGQPGGTSAVGDPTAPPGPEPPAEVAWLLRNGVVRERDVAVTLVDLAARGHVALAADAVRRGPGDGSVLAPHDAVLLTWLFGAADAPGQVAVGDLVARVRRDPGGWKALRLEFTEAVEAEGREDGLVERALDDERVVGAGVAAAAVVVLGIVGTALGQPAWLVCSAVGGLALVTLDALARRSPEGARLAAAWRAHGEHLDGLPAVPADQLALGVVLHAEPAVADPTAQRALALVEALGDAYVTATSYLAPPTRRRARTRAGAG